MNETEKPKWDPSKCAVAVAAEKSAREEHNETYRKSMEQIRVLTQRLMVKKS